MITPAEQLDRRFEALAPLTQAAARPSRGWIRAIRDALGMTTAQLAMRMKVHQPRISELEKAELSGSISLKTLERAAEAMGCRVVYTLVPTHPLTDMIDERAQLIAGRQLASLDQTMRLEDQRVTDKRVFADARARIVDELRRKPARLWDDV